MNIYPELASLLLNEEDTSPLLIKYFEDKISKIHYKKGYEFTLFLIDIITELMNNVPELNLTGSFDFDINLDNSITLILNNDVTISDNFIQYNLLLFKKENK